MEKEGVKRQGKEGVREGGEKAKESVRERGNEEEKKIEAGRHFLLLPSLLHFLCLTLSSPPSPPQDASGGGICFKVALNVTDAYSQRRCFVCIPSPRRHASACRVALNAAEEKLPTQCNGGSLRATAEPVVT